METNEPEPTPTTSGESSRPGFAKRTSPTILGATLALGAFRSEAQAADTPASYPMIVPDDEMAGVVGDLVRSNKGDTGERHFVSPKKSTEIAADYVNFKAVGVTAEEFQNLYQWEPVTGGEAIPADPLKYRVKRDATRKVVIKIVRKNTGQLVDKINVWIVWATGTAHRLATPIFEKFAAIPAQPPAPATPAGSLYAGPNSAQGWRFVFKIEPASIITADERPNLEGNQDTQHDVPGAGKPWPTNPARSADEAIKKWDTSRQMKWTITDASGTTNPVSFPSDNVEGNDDADGHGMDEDDNPYVASTTPSIAHAVGEISSTDGPSFGRYVTQGTTDGEIYRKEVDFREFARVQLWDGVRAQGQYWFRISDYILWHHHFRAKFNVPILPFFKNTWKNDGSNDGQP